MGRLEANRRYRARLKGKSVPLQLRKFAPEEDALIREVYSTLLRGDGQLARLCERLLRPADAIQSRAALLGLTNPRRGLSDIRRQQLAERLRQLPTRKWHFMTRDQAEHWLNAFEASGKTFLAFCKDHQWKDGSRGFRSVLRRYFPERLKMLVRRQHETHASRYFTGVPLSAVHRRKIGLAHLGRIMSPRTRAKLALRVAERLRENPSAFSRKQVSKGGWRDDLGRFVRSSWEANYARFLTFSKVRWEYEPKTFWFPVKRGTRSYTPDFYLPDEDAYHEIKGWLDPKSMTKLKRMAKYYPDVKIVVIGGRWFSDANRKGLCRLIPNWECSHRSHNPPS